MGTAGRVWGGGLGWSPWCLPIGAARHGGAGDRVEKGQAVPLLHLRGESGAPSTLAGEGGPRRGWAMG